MSPVVFQRPEEELLCGCARTQWSPEVRARVQRLIDGGPDWDAVLTLAWQHRLSPLLLNGLVGMDIEAVPPGVLHRLGRTREVSAVHSLLRARELIRVLRLFREHGIEALAFKGPVLGQEAYLDLGLRPFGDLDLLLNQADLLRAKRLLCENGYRPRRVMSEPDERAFLDGQFAYSLVRDDHRVEIELHWALAHRVFAFRVNTDAIWERSRRIELGGCSVRTLGLEDLLVFLCAHGAKHEWEQLVWLCDVAELLRRYPALDGEQVLMRAGEAKAGRMLRLGLLLAYRLFEAPLPPRLLAACHADPALGRLADQVIAQVFREGEPRFSERLRFHLVAHDDWRGRSQNLLQVLRLATTPSPKDRAFLSLPERWGFLYYLVRPIRVVHGMVWEGTGRSRSHEC